MRYIQHLSKYPPETQEGETFGGFFKTDSSSFQKDSQYGHILSGQQVALQVTQILGPRGHTAFEVWTVKL